MSNKYSIVTGASRGLGAAIAEELAREGYDVVITYCTQADKAQKVKKQLETKFGVRVESYQLDIKDEEAVLAFRKWVEETLGTNLQVLVNNAGIYANMPAEEIASKTFCDIMQVVGEGPAAGLVGGLVGVVVEIVFGTFVLTLMIKKDVAKGLKFAYGPNDIRVADDKQLPNFLISLIPLLSVVIFFNVVKLDIFSSCLAAWLLSIILLGKYMPKKDGSLLKELLDVCTVSGTNAFGPCGMVGSLFGFVSVVQTLPEFQAILNYIFSLNMAPFLVLILSINIVGALTGSSSSAIRIGMPMAMQHCIDAGMSLAFVQRLGAFAASILDTLPHSSAIIINLGIADQDMKEAYPPMAVTTILTTAVGTAAVAIFMSLFPSLP